MLTKKIIYETTDGSHFENREDAELHELACIISRGITQNHTYMRRIYGETGVTISEDSMFDIVKVILMYVREYDDRLEAEEPNAKCTDANELISDD